MSSRLGIEIQEQRAANESAAPFADLYASHREQLTAQVLRAAQAVEEARTLCILGAGNCNDIDLERLLGHFEVVHLVDLDEAALERACSNLGEALRAKLVCHAPVDLSGMLDKLERWGSFQLTPEELAAHPGALASGMVQTLGGPFDVVVSACVVTQMQFAILNALTDKHRLFPALRHTLTVTHLRSLAALTRAGGRAVLATDLVASDHLNLTAGSGIDLRTVFDQVVKDGNVMYVAHPGVFESVVKDDPILSRTAIPDKIQAVWLWQQGPNRTFLVYAMDLVRRNTA